MHDIVFWLQVFSVVPFIIACAGVVLLAHGDTRRQARAALLTIANPLLIWAVVAGAHNEALSVMFAVGGLLFMRKNPFVAGLGIGLAGCAKLSIGIWGLAMLWAYRREPKKALLLCLGTLSRWVWRTCCGSQRPSSRRCATVVMSRSGPGPTRSIAFFDRLHDWVPRQGHRRRDLVRRLDRDRLDAVPGGALDRRLLVWTRMPTCGGIR